MKAIYTVLLNNYDTLKEPRFIQPGFDYIAFTDDKTLTSKTWIFRYVEGDVYKQRDIKIRPHHYLPQYEQTVYVDASHELRRDLKTLLKPGFHVSVHPTRNCVYDEAGAITKAGRAEPLPVQNQLRVIREAGVRRKAGLWETGFMIRDNSEKVIELCDKWAQLTAVCTHRDQLSLPHAVHITGIKPTGMPASTVRACFYIHPHNKPAPIVKSKVHYMVIWDTGKNFGKCINDFCKTIPEGDWICVRDGDSMFLTSHWGKQIEDVANGIGQQYVLLGCMTNRLKSPHQCIDGMFDEKDITRHYEKALELELSRYGQIEQTNGSIAGMLMLFPKATWNKIKFREKELGFDSHFGNDCRRMGKVGLMTGVYVFHGFRIWSETPKSSVHHLI